MSDEAGGRRVIPTLIVEDNPAVVDVLSAFVDAQERFGLVGVAQTGAAAVAAVRAKRPQFVMLDFSLPDFGGLDVLRWVRAEHPEPVEVIALTAARDIESITRARSLGVRHYLVKPFTAVSLSSRLGMIARQLDDLASERPLLEQDDVDRVMSTAELPTSSTIRPKGISRSTVDSVVAVLDNAGEEGLSAAELSVVLAMSRSSARRYLEHLVDAGLARVGQRFGVPGRPVNTYTSAVPSSGR